MFTSDEVLPFLGAETNSLFTELCGSMLSANICCSLFIFSPGVGGGGRGSGGALPYLAYAGMCHEQGMVFKVVSIRFHY